MRNIPHRLTFVNAAFVVTLVTSLFSGSAVSQEVTSFGGSQLGKIPEFHPELKYGWLQGYLDPKMLPNSLTLIPPPPAPGSTAFALDEEFARGTFALHGAPRFALAEADFDLNYTNLINDFSCSLNVQLTEENAPYLFTLLRRSIVDIGLSTYTAKNFYKRTRPFMANKEAIGVPSFRADLEKDPSYPSGHTAVGWGFALILTEISPDRTDELLARGRAYGDSRMVVNHHWYSDVDWGRFMGAAAVARLHADPIFRADMEAARAEVAAVRAKGASPTLDCTAEAAALSQGFQSK